MIGFLSWRGTPQRYDPVAARAVYPLIGLAALGTMVFALVHTVLFAGQIVDPPAASASIALLVVAALVVLIVADPVNAPVRFAGFAAAIVAVNLANAASAISTWGVVGAARGDWGPLAVGILLLCFAEFRPGRDLAAATVLSMLATGTVAALEAAGIPGSPPSLSAAVIAGTPAVLFGVGSSVFSYRMSLGLSRKADAAAREQAALGRRVRIRLRGMMRESGRRALAAELVPFLDRVLERGEVNETDNAEARRISAVLRSVMITEMGLPWLERMERADAEGLVVRDHDRSAEAFTMEQQVALRALVTELQRVRARTLAADPDARLEPVHVRIGAVGAHRSVFLRVGYAGTASSVRPAFGTFVTVMNAVFGRSSVRLVNGELRMLFAYGSRRRTGPAPTAPRAPGPAGPRSGGSV